MAGLVTLRAQKFHHNGQRTALPVGHVKKATKPHFRCLFLCIAGFLQRAANGNLRAPRSSWSHLIHGGNVGRLFSHVGSALIRFVRPG